MRRWISSACHSTMCGAPSPFPVHTAHPPPQGCGNPLCGPPVFATCAAAHALSTRSPPLPVQMIKTSGRGRGRGGGRGGGRGRGGAFKRGGGAKQAAAAAIQKPGGGIQKKTLSQMSAAAQSLSRAGGLTTGAIPILGAHATLRALPPRATHTHVAGSRQALSFALATSRALSRPTTSPSSSPRWASSRAPRSAPAAAVARHVPVLDAALCGVGRW